MLTSLLDEDMVGEKRKISEHPILQQPTEPIHKPCLGLYKEHKDMSVKDTAKGKTMEATRKVSPVLQHEQLEKGDYVQKQNCLVNDDVAIGEHVNIISDSALGRVEDISERKTQQAARKILVRSPFFQHEQIEKNNCDQKQDSLVKGDVAFGEHESSNSDCSLGKDSIERKTAQATRKILVRSPFFQHEQVEKNTCDRKQDCLIKDDDIGETKSMTSDKQMMDRGLKRNISPSDQRVGFSCPCFPFQKNIPSVLFML